MNGGTIDPRRNEGRTAPVVARSGPVKISSCPADDLTVFSIVLAVVVGLVTIALLLGVAMVRSLKRASIHLLPGFQIAHTIDAPRHIERGFDFDPTAAIDELVAIGFRPVGSLRFDLPSHSAVFSTLLSPTGDSFATLTPVHMTVCSDFGGKLIDTSSGAAGVPMPYQLNQTSKASPSELVALHQATLDRISALTGHRPDRHTEATTMPLTLEIERCSLATFSVLRQMLSPFASLFRTAKRSNRPSDRAIERWFESGDRWAPVPA